MSSLSLISSGMLLFALIPPVAASADGSRDIGCFDRVYPTDYTTVQAAIDAACNGDSVILLDHATFEDLSISNKDLTVVGNGFVANSLTWAGGTGRVEGLQANTMAIDPTDLTGSGLTVSFEAHDLSGVDFDMGLARADVSMTECSFSHAMIGIGDEAGSVTVADCFIFQSLTARSLELTIVNNWVQGPTDLVTHGGPTTITGNTFNERKPGETGVRLFGDFVGSMHWVSDNIFSNFDVAIALGSGGGFGARRNNIVGCGIGVDIEGGVVESNRIVNCGTGIRAFAEGTIIGNTIAECTDIGLDLQFPDAIDVSNNIVTAATVGIMATGIPTFTCNDVWDNGSDYVGIADPTGIDGNIRVDPLFCDPEAFNYTLEASSPCLPDQHPDGFECGLIGALGIGCVVNVAVDDVNSPIVQRLLSARPNPTRGGMEFEVAAEVQGRQLNIYDTGGRLVRSLSLPAGGDVRRVAWDGLDSRGARVAAGVYHTRVDGAATSVAGRVVVVD